VITPLQFAAEILSRRRLVAARAGHFLAVIKPMVGLKASVYFSNWCFHFFLSFCWWFFHRQSRSAGMTKPDAALVGVS
jgi:hypothetical protein